MNNKITNTDINEFEEFLINKNKSRTTLDKYMRDIRRFQIFLSDNSYPISQDTADKYIEILKNADYSISSINTIISCINTFCNFIFTALILRNLRLNQQFLTYLQLMNITNSLKPL